MARRKVVTADVVNQIEAWVDSGLSAVAIAEKIGCTLGTLRVRCSQFHISLRRKTRAVRRGLDIVADRNTGLGSADPKIPRGTASPWGDTIPVGRDDHLAISLPEPILRGLRRRAAQEGISEGALAVRLLGVIVEDDLYKAVLDVDETRSASGNQVIPLA